MSKKLTNNGLFDSSRFMLPEHKEGILDDFKRQQWKIRPSLDRQQLDYIAVAIARSALPPGGNNRALVRIKTSGGRFSAFIEA